MADSIPVAIVIHGNTVMADKFSITSREFFQASGYGMKPQAMYKVSAALYAGEDRITDEHGVVLAVYRTYQTGDRVELYVEKRAGVR